MNNTIPSEISQPFRPRARVLQLLGDELIGSARLAVFELVKNAYDADANKVVVRLDLASEEPTITVRDDGEGMTLDTLRSVWLVPGDDHRRRQRLSDQRTTRHQRLPLGEKGLGRFAVHKLGNRITLVTRARGSDECVVEIDWNELIAQPYLDQAPVTIKLRIPRRFPDNKTGTSIRIRELRTDWTRGGEVRRLHNQITSICSPFEEPSGFQAVLRVPGCEEWIADLPDASEILDRAIWKFSFQADKDRFDWRYEFCQVPGFNLDSRVVEKSGDWLKLPSRRGDDRMEKKVVADEATFKGIGSVTGEFYVYDRDREVRQRLTNIRLLENYLDETGGVRVYRDGIRVYNYGELGDDWLGLDLRRVNVPTRRISRNIILGAVHLSLRESTSLIEKTNREGFVENDACVQLRRIVLGALAALEEERQLDKERIRRLTAKPDDPISRIEKPIEELRRELKRQGVDDRFENYVVKIENDYRNMQETLLSAGMSGLNLAVVFHEVERGVRALHQVIAEGEDMESAARQARDLMRLLDGFSTLLRRDSKKQHSGRKLVKAARQFNRLRLRHHRVRLVCPLLRSGSDGFHSRFAFSLVLGALNNLIDNALYWLRVRWPDLPAEDDSPERKLYIGVSHDFDAGPAIVVADNGVGFEGDAPENLVRPFFTRKPDGMGLGLYYANLAMELNEGQCVFPRPGEVEVPDEFDGAVVALIFKEVEMMLPTPRVIVIDDESKHLLGLTEGLNRYGAACLPIHFTGETENIPPCPHVRVIFADLHLTGGPVTDHAKDFSTIGGLIEDSIKPSGPYLIVLWTQYPEQADRLRNYLNNLEGVTKPFTVRALNKNDHLDSVDGSVKSTEVLVEAIRRIVTGQPQVAALLNWEERVLDAAADTISSILELAEPVTAGLSQK